MNEYQKQRFAKRIICCLGNDVTDKNIAVLGFAFKPNTSDTRESPAITLVNSLAYEGARVTIYDPKVEEQQMWKELMNEGGNVGTLRTNILYCNSAYEACKDADAVVIVTGWAEFSNKSPVDDAVPITTPIALAKLDPNLLVSSDPLLSPSGKRLSTALLVQNIQDDRDVWKAFSEEDRRRIVRIERIRKSKYMHTVYFGSYEEAESALSRQPCENKIGRAPQAAGPSRKPYMKLYHERRPSSAKILPSDIPRKTQPPLLYKSEKASEQQCTSSRKHQQGLSTVRIDWDRIAEGMRKPMYVFDGRNILDAAKSEALGFRVEAVGRASTQ